MKYFLKIGLGWLIITLFLLFCTLACWMYYFIAMFNREENE
jgi:hypothetical protein